MLVRWASMLVACSACGSRTELDGPRIIPSFTALCPEGPDDPRLPELALGRTSELDASLFLEGQPRSVQWTFLEEECDELVRKPGSTLASPNSPRVLFTPGRSGIHHASFEATDPFGQEASCDFELVVPGRGLRIELCWEESTTVDLDVYLHTPHNMAPFLDPAAADILESITPDTCNPANCAAELRFGSSRPNFGYADSPLDFCDEGPAAEEFRALGRCPNPRTGQDNNQFLATGTSEIVQLDAPRDAETFRIMVNNFDNSPTSPRVFVYCDGVQSGRLDAPSAPAGFVAPDPGVFGVMWRAADVLVHADTNGELSCSVFPLFDPLGTGPYVTIDDPSY